MRHTIKYFLVAIIASCGLTALAFGIAGSFLGSDLITSIKFTRIYIIHDLIAYSTLLLFMLKEIQKSKAALTAVCFGPLTLTLVFGYFIYRMSMWYDEDPFYHMRMATPFYVIKICVSLIICLVVLNMKKKGSQKPAGK